MKAFYESKTYYAILILFLLSFGIRFFYNNTVIFSPPIIRADTTDYYHSAKNLYQFGVYSKEKANSNPPTPDSFRPPLLPVVMMLSVSAFKSDRGKWYGYVILFQIFLGALIAPLIYYLAIMTSLPPRGAFIIGLLTTLDPCLVTVTGYLLPEVYVSFFLLLFLVLCIRLKTNKNMLWVFMGGITATLLYFSREEYLFVPIIISVYHFREWPKGYIVLLLVFLLLPTIWMVRKANLSESPSRLRIAAFEGSLPFPEIEGPKRYMVARLPQYKKFEPMKKGWTEFLTIMVQRIKETPKLIFWYFPQKSLNLLKFNFLQGYDIYIYPVLKSIWQLPFFYFLKIMSKYLFYFSIPLCLLGLSRCFMGKNKELKGIALVMIFYFAFFHIFVPLSKYMIPFRPIIYLFAFLYISNIWPELREGRLINKKWFTELPRKETGR